MIKHIVLDGFDEIVFMDERDALEYLGTEWIMWKPDQNTCVYLTNNDGVDTIEL